MAVAVAMFASVDVAAVGRAVAAASVVGDFTVGLMVQVAFTVLGVAVLAAAAPAGAVTWALVLIVAAAFVSMSSDEVPQRFHDGPLNQP